MNQAVLEQKKKAVEAISDKMKEAKSTVVVEYRGLNVAETTELRRALRAENIQMGVYKNSLAERAADGLGFDELNASMKGPNALVFGDDAVAPARILAKFAKKHKNLVLKAGVVEGRFVDQNGLKELASLPNKEGMLSMLLGCLQSPVRSFARAFQAVAEAKEQNAGNETATPVEADKPAPEAASAN